tara:strand:- start:5011 stop:5742 length:732 start_codon:yes stop_codon:yes gene_type:complete
MTYIRLEDVSVDGIDSISRAESLKSFLTKKRGKYIPEKVEILKNISLEINKGDKLGILGLNGSGKTTLLKVIAGCYLPQKGDVFINGKVMSLMGLGAEFMPELSGNDNIKLAYAFRNNLLEYSENIKEKIINFSGLKEHIDKPLVNYSSGMIARFAFSSVIFQTCNILLLDEVFATGDALFVNKATEAMKKRWESVDIGIFVSHTSSQISEICNKAIILKDGEVYASGSTSDMIDIYNKEIII